MTKPPAKHRLTRGFTGACDRNRTRDHRFTRAALYLLSYTGAAPQGHVTFWQAEAGLGNPALRGGAPR